MSYNNNLKMYCEVLEQVETRIGSMPTMTWQTVPGADRVRCFLDLFFIRPGKDPVWNPDTGRASNRAGVLFVKASTDLVPGNRIKMLVGPSGTFLIDKVIDEAWSPKKPTRRHHIEVYVTEVDRALA